MKTPAKLGLVGAAVEGWWRCDDCGRTFRDQTDDPPEMHDLQHHHLRIGNDLIAGDVYQCLARSFLWVGWKEKP